jgi:hypothetical protein
MDTKLFNKFMDRPDVETLGELAEILRCPLIKLESVQQQVKSLSAGPPYKVGFVVLELLTENHISLEDMGQTEITQPTEAMLAVAAHVVSSSLRNAAFGDFLENVLDDPKLKRVSLQGDSASLSDAIRMEGGLKKKKWAPVEKKESLVIALSRPLSAALFFDRVWTLDRAIPGTIGFRCGHINEQIALGLLDGLIDDFTMLEANEDFRDEKRDMTDEFLRSPAVESLMSKAFAGILAPVFEKLTIRPVQTYFASEENLRGTYSIGSTPMVIAALESLEWIDEEHLTWEQVAEVRKDMQSVSALKRMLHWLDSEMAGKPIWFVADEIQLRIAEYENATSKHGIKLVRGAFGTFLDVKLLYSLLGSMIGGKLDPNHGELIGFLAGITAQGCRVVFETLNLHVESKTKLDENPVAYIHHLKNKSASEIKATNNPIEQSG